MLSAFPLGRSQRGLTMIEVLITVVILAIGMLSMGALQLMSKRSNFEAAQRTTATFLAHDILERMRVNPTQLEEYAGTQTELPVAMGTPRFATAPGVLCSAAGSNCNAFELSQFDLWEWEQMLLGASEVLTTDGTQTGGLAEPTACLYTTVPSGATNRSGQYMVAIAWRGGTKLSNPTAPAAMTPDPYACGADTSKYHSSTTATDNAHRRVLVVTTYIHAP